MAPHAMCPVSSRARVSVPGVPSRAKADVVMVWRAIVARSQGGRAGSWTVAERTEATPTRDKKGPGGFDRPARGRGPATVTQMRQGAGRLVSARLRLAGPSRRQGERVVPPGALRTVVEGQPDSYMRHEPPRSRAAIGRARGVPGFATQRPGPHPHKLLGIVIGGAVDIDKPVALSRGLQASQFEESQSVTGV